MKKLLLMAAALLTMTCCKEETPQDEPKADKVSVLPESKDFDNNGGTVSVMVTSTGEWKLGTKENATYDWVSTDKTSGADGDMIKFTVAPNETEETRFAYYVFTSGTATAEFKITSFAGDIQTPSISVEETEIVKDYNAGSFEVLVKYSEGVDYRSIKAEIPEDASWLTHKVTLEGDEEGTAKMVFEYEALEGYKNREAAFTIAYDEASVAMKMTQTPKPAIVPESVMYSMPLEGGVLEIKVNASVAYNVDIVYGEGGEDWLTDYALNGDVNTWTCNIADSKREATVKFTEAAPAEGAEPIVAEVKVVQSNALITTVARMNDYRAAFKSVNDLPNKDVFKLGKNMTVEFLINPETNSFAKVSAMFGIERRFLIRHSDGKKGMWEVVYAKNSQWQGEHDEVKVQGSLLMSDRWIHIAVTVDETNNMITLYQNGEVMNSASLNPDMKLIDFTEEYEANNQTQQFAIGYAYDNSRFFRGMMSEVRIWNRALTKEEINAENHFYKVEPNADGLVAYWKMDDAKGSVFKDYTSNGNNLEGQVYTGSWKAKDIVWESVSLPE